MRDLGLHHQQSVSLCDALDRVLHTGVVALGEVTISVADVDLLYVGLQLVITSIEAGREPGAVANDWPAAGRMVRDGPHAEWTPNAAPVLAASTPTSPSVPVPETNELSATLLTPSDLDHPLPTLNSAGQPSKKNGLGQLVLTLVKVLHELLKRQAVRRLEAGSLSAVEMERLGVTLMRQAQEIERMANELGLKQDDLNLDLGPLGKLL